VNSSVEEEVNSFKECLRTHGANTVHLLLSAFLIWLFGNLVFIPLADSLSWQVKTFCTLMFFIAFTALISKALPGFKKLVDAFSVFPARKYVLKRGLAYEDSLVISQHAIYVFCLFVFYLLYFPFLENFHPTVSGIVLILVLIMVFFLALRTLIILSAKIAEWLRM
jgi:hypothetical protein